MPNMSNTTSANPSQDLTNQDESPIQLTITPTGVAIITLHRPEAKNALNLVLRKALADAVTQATNDTTVKAIVVTGGEKVFAAGADVREFATATTTDMYLRRIEQYWQPLVDCPKPMIAAVNGFALGGGCELAMHTDIIIAGEGAKFGQPEVKLGLMPGAGGTQRLIRAVGKFKAMRLLLTGDMLSAEQAYDMGLVSDVVPDDTTLTTAITLAEKIAQYSPIAVAQIKEVSQLGADMPLNVGLALERKAFQILFDTQDKKEGINAFLEKRTAIYQGK